MSICVVITILAMGCGNSDHHPIAMDVYVDSTFSNDQVARGCVADVILAAKLAAASRGTLSFHTFDGDPLRRRGMSAIFSEGEIPAELKGTSGEDEYLEEQAEKLRGRIEALIAKPPKVGGSPLLGVLERAARSRHGSAAKRILICTDGLFTDVNPNTMTREEAHVAGEELKPQLEGATVDFIGLDASAVGRGRLIEQTRPVVKAVLVGAGAEMGNWNVELDPSWRERTLAAADGGAG
jgi:hypothetical protein